MNTTTRIDTFINTLHEANKTEPSHNHDHGNPTDKLTTLTGNINDLCRELAAATKPTNPSNKIITADRIKHNATNIIATCITELKNLDHTTEDAIDLIATDGALWFWSLPLRPLSTLDQDTPTDERIQSLQISTGHLMEWWPNMLSPQNEVDLNAERERAFINLAYEATCAIITHTHQSTHPADN